MNGNKNDQQLNCTSFEAIHSVSSEWQRMRQGIVFCSLPLLLPVTCSISRTKVAVSAKDLTVDSAIFPMSGTVRPKSTFSVHEEGREERKADDLEREENWR